MCSSRAMMQQGIHSGIDIVREPDIKVFDSLLTLRLTERHIDSRHHLQQLSIMPQALAGVKIDTLATIRTPGYSPSAESLVFDYKYDSSNNCLYRLHIEPLGRSVIRQMTGILASSAATFLILTFVFWYLIRTILRQRSLEEMKDDFTHNITHELKTPVSVAYAANDALLQFADDLDRKTRENYLKMSLEQLKKLSGMIEQILSMSMNRRKTFTLHKEMLDLKKTISEIVEQQRMKTKKPVDIPREDMPTQHVIGDYQLDTMKEHLVFATDNADAEIIPLSHRESEILRLFCSSKGEVVNNRDILLELWGDDSYFNTRSLHVFITKLRRKLSRDPRLRIINVRGIGYKLIC